MGGYGVSNWSRGRCAARRDAGVWRVGRGGAVPGGLVREAAPAYASGWVQAPAAIMDEAAARADDLLELGDRIAELARSIQVAEAEMMRLIVEFDDRRGWEEAGFGSCAEWLAWRIGVRPNSARERVRTARALARLPRAAAAMAAGELPYAKARALTRVATPESEEALLALAAAGSAENLERVVRAWKAMDDERELSFEEARHRRRWFSVVVDTDGSYRVRGRLDPEVGAVLARAVEAAEDALYRADEGSTADDPTPAQRRADAVGLLAERALAAGFGGADHGVESSRADRYQVLLHVAADTLIAGRPSRRSELDGVRVGKEQARRLTCDAGVAVIEHTRRVAPRVTAETRAATPAQAVAPHVTAETSALAATPIVGVGRRTRTIPPAVRRALLARDRGCRFPGCGSRFVEAHHIVHWADGGGTDLANLVLLCRRHHRAVHERGMTIAMDRESVVVFFTAEGRAVAATPAPSGATLGLPPPPPSAAAYPGAARYRSDRDIPWRVEARARDALDR